MNMLVETLDKASAHPAIWIGICLIAAHGIVAFWQWRTCPYICGRALISREEAMARLSNPFLAGPRFFATMLAGIAAVLAGLALIDADIEPVYALLLVIAGVFVVQTEPARLRISEAIARVVAAEAAGTEAVQIAQKRLRDSHLWFVSLNFILALAMAAGVLAF